jgi:dTDP-D-glucose 4,6-dehydratase
MGERSGQVDRHVAANLKAYALLDWIPKTSFDLGLNITIEWYRNNPEWWQKIAWMSKVQTKNKNGEIEYY